VAVQVHEDTESNGGESSSYNVTAITPMPSAEILKSLDNNPVTLDTWVELSFVDESGNEVGTIRRSVERSPRGKIKVSEPHFSVLGLDPVAREVGTRMPGLIPYVQVGAACDLGKAVAALTGLRPLQDLVKHAAKSKDKLEKVLVEDRDGEIEELDRGFLQAREEIEGLITEHPQITPETPLPGPGPETTVEEQLTSCAKHFEKLQAGALADCRLILGESFDPKDWEAREDLTEKVGPAIGQLDHGNLARLPSASRLDALASLTDKELSGAEALVQKLVSEANELVELEEEPEVAARLRLYARVAGWIKDLPKPPHVIENCPVCQSVLEGKTDPVTEKPVAEHIQQQLDVVGDHFEKTIAAWEKSALAILADELPGALLSELRTDLPQAPSDLISKALGDELFESDNFKGTLAPLSSAVQSMCSEVLRDLPPFKEPETPDLALRFGDGDGDIRQAVRRVTRAIAFARWRQNNKDHCKKAFRTIIGEATSPEDGGRPVESCSLSQRLAALDRMVKSATPLTAALSKVGVMAKKLAERRQKEKRIALYGRASVAIEGLLGLNDLVEQQVGSLLKRLSSATAEWKHSFYSSAFVGAPEVVGTYVGADGAVEIDAVAEGTKASAAHVSNASDLRATLLAFLVAFWQDLLETRGGLSVLLLDDLQELFDAPNRRLVANSIPSIVEQGGRVIVTTNDPVFRRCIADSAAKTLGSDKTDCRCIHPLNAARPHIELGHFTEVIEKKRRAFEDPANENESQPAREYVNELRMYIENRLLDFFDVPAAKLPKKPTLSDLMGAIRARRNNGHDAFVGQVFSDLVSDPALTKGSPFVDLLNLSHHGNQNKITFKAVWQVKGACVRVRELVDAAYEEYERWLRREPRAFPRSKPVSPEPVTLQPFNVPVIENLAAFTVDTSPGEALETEERFTSDWLANHAVYVISTHNFGFAGPMNCRAIVDLSHEAITDNALVIAMHQDKVYARRLLHDDARSGIIALGSEAEDPRKRPPSVFLPMEEVRLLRVVGLLFDDRPHYPRAKEEAVLVNDAYLLEKTEVVWEVREDSALPLALPGQTILGGSCLMPDQLQGTEGHLVAIATSDGSVLKRIGKALPGARHIRVFESVGGLGESMLVRTEEVDDTFGDLPLLHSAHRVLGVLYVAPS